MCAPITVMYNVRGVSPHGCVCLMWCTKNKFRSASLTSILQLMVHTGPLERGPKLQHSFSLVSNQSAKVKLFHRDTGVTVIAYLSRFDSDSQPEKKE